MEYASREKSQSLSEEQKETRRHSDRLKGKKINFSAYEDENDESESEPKIKKNTFKGKRKAPFGNETKNIYENITKSAKIPPSDTLVELTITENGIFPLPSTERPTEPNDVIIPEQSLTKVQTQKKSVETNLTLSSPSPIPGTYISCDLRYFNFKYLTDQLGSFDVVMIDPPWRIKGGERVDSSFMFSNNQFNLEYNTMSNSEILNLKVEELSRKGFCFLWVLNSQLLLGYECLQKWGYEVIDQIIWVKTRNNKVFTSHGYYFLHSYEICLVGYKTPPGECVEFVARVSNNVIFAEVQGKSRKPVEIYEIIELMMPGAKKIELFARNNNLRYGWFSLGNELGEAYEEWEQKIYCNICQKSISHLQYRYKSKFRPDFDLCSACVKQYPSEQFYKIIGVSKLFNKKINILKMFG